ncbi:manganese catalase family protein [Atopococcus tabaci]|uniref:manganese catalase family protein n=1 Tax=Atopococcus tabaci TaxID=269774 RepID=UPI0009FEE82E|nr:manganese catalase family protein [Atopococcus tabaci]
MYFRNRKADTTFTHTKKLQYHAKPDKPDPLMARRIQEILAGQWGEMTVMHQYLFQGWNLRWNEKYKDLLLDTGTEEIGHVEMLATMIAQLVDGAPVNLQESVYNSGDPAVAAVMGGMDPQHAIVHGLGAHQRNSNGVPWNADYFEASGNLLADMRFNLTAESMGRLQVARLYHMTTDKGVRDMLSFLLARDTQHQLQWQQAIKELEEKEGFIVPKSAESFEHTEFNHTLYNFSEGDVFCNREVHSFATKSTQCCHPIVSI